jgi:hypothetical protein
MVSAAFSSRGGVKTLSIDEERRAVLVTTMENGLSANHVYEASDLAGVERARDELIIAKAGGGEAAGAAGAPGQPYSGGGTTPGWPPAGGDEPATVRSLFVRLRTKRDSAETIWFQRDHEIGTGSTDYAWMRNEAQACFEKLAALIAPARPAPGIWGGEPDPDAVSSRSCSDCDGAIPPGDLFCTNCGAKVG